MPVATRFDIESPDRGRQLAIPLDDMKREPKFLDRLVIKSSGRVLLLRIEEIDWIEAAGNYLRLHLGAETHLLRRTMNHLEAQLNAHQFMRIHRSAMVNIERIKELQPMFQGDYAVILRNGTELTLSRTYRRNLQQLFADSSLQPGAKPSS